MSKIKEDSFVLISDDEPPSPPKRPRKTLGKKSTLKAVPKDKKLKSSPKPKAPKTSKEAKKEDEEEQLDEDIKINPKLKFSCDKQELLAELENIDSSIARNLIRLFTEDNTIPFIARYRKELTGHMTPEKLRDVKKSYDDIIKIQSRAQAILNTLENQGKLNNGIKQDILSAKSLSELEHIYSPFKVSKHTLAERARQLGLEPIALDILHGTRHVDPSASIVKGEKGLESIAEILLGIQHIIAEIISKDRDLLDQIQRMYKHETIFIESSLSKSSKSENSKETKAKVKPKAQSSNYQKNKPPKNVDPEKFKLYFEFKRTVGNVHPHQVLAINRGESLKLLSVKITVPDRVRDMLCNFCEHKWLRKGLPSTMRTKLLIDSFHDAYKRLINPLICRETRAELDKKAQKASIEVFSNNLKHLLLTQPVKAIKILGIDPGFTNGCKMALISERGDLLDTAVIYPHTRQNNAAGEILSNMMHKHCCSLIALGNGTACRETESFIGDLIKQGKLPSQSKYSIVNERGASIYSCSNEALKEFPKLDPNLRSAVYIARCLQDPLCEMVKIDPKHLGVGMYQHDVPEKVLSTTLHEVVVECVSFVGVDINTASSVLLKHVAGLNGAKADKIIEFRGKFGPFISRERLRDVPGIGAKSFEQFAGFVRIISETSECETNPLDATWVHPESYTIAEKIAQEADIRLDELGTTHFITRMQSYLMKSDKKILAERFGAPEERVVMVVEALCKDPNKDYRCDSKANEPLFKCDVTSLADLRCGDVVTGVVANVTHFGSFVDIGVGNDGLIPMSALKRFSGTIELGYRVEVRVDNVDVQRKRISLSLVKIL